MCILCAYFATYELFIVYVLRFVVVLLKKDVFMLCIYA